MKDLFFYGTLRDLGLLETVLGRGAEGLDVRTDLLQDHAVLCMAKGLYPTIIRQDKAQAEGLLVRGLSAEDLRRLDFYEGGFAYDLREVTLASGARAEVYFPAGETQDAANGTWSFADWQTQWGKMTVIAAQEVMGYYGDRAPQEVAGMFPMIRARAASTLRAGQSRHGRDAFRGAFRIKSRERSYARFWALDDLMVEHARFDGSMSETLDRAVFVAADAAFVLPYDPTRDRVLVIEQVRIGAAARGDRTCWFMEPIAGRIDAGETPEAAARREAEEEAGLRIGAMEPIAEIYPTAGSSTEFFYLFLGIADLPDDVTGQGGLDTEHEDIRSHLWSFDELMERVASRDLGNNILVTSALYLAHHRDRLRSEGAKATPDVK